MVDVLKEYAPPPLNKAPEYYPKITRVPKAWGLGYYLSDGDRRTRLLAAGSWMYTRRSIRALVAQHPSDLIVSVHPLATDPVLRALGPNRPPFITVVTDLVSTHAFWYHRRADLSIVPTMQARHRALELGVDREHVKVIGLPVADRFCHPQGDRRLLREQLGWPQDRPVVLLLGGGEGMGPLEKTAHAIASRCSPAALAVVAGRNHSLHFRLNSCPWPVPTFVYGFVKEIPDFMAAADILVTKAGPGTISEALIAGLPMVLYSRLPGQEEGNIPYVVSEGAGIWAPHLRQVTEAINFWIGHPEELSRAANNCRRLGRPDAARRIARELAARVEAAA